MNTTRSLLASYLRIRSLASSVSSPELAQARRELESTVQDLSFDLQDLVDSVKAVETDRFQYGLGIDEVSRRRKLVSDVGTEVEEMRKELRKTMAGVVSNGYAANGNAVLPPPSAFDPDSPDGDAYGAFEQQRQVEMMHEQDEALDGVFKTVGNLRQQADDMGRELEEQVELLDDVNQLTDRVQGKLQKGIRKVGWVIKNTEGACKAPSVTSRGRDNLGSLLFRDLVKLLYRRAHFGTGITAHPRVDPLIPGLR